MEERKTGLDPVEIVSGDQEIDRIISEMSAAKYNSSLLHQVVVAAWAAQRRGTKSQKTRAEVRGGGKKPWRQKGTGRARAGSIRSPIWRGGGVTFAASPRDYHQKVNKKVYRHALRIACGEFARQGAFRILSDIEVTSHRTKEFVARFGGVLPLGEKMVSFLGMNLTEEFILASRNIPSVYCTTVESLSLLSLVRSDYLALNKASLLGLFERFYR